MDKDKKVGEQEAEVVKDYLILDLNTPVDYQGMHITRLDMTRLRDMTGRELNTIYSLYSAQGGNEIALQESTLLFAQVIASRVCKIPLEAVMELKAKDSVYLKNRVYRFFLMSE